MSAEDEALDINNISPYLRTNRISRYKNLVATWAGEDDDEEKEVDETEEDTGGDSSAEEEEEEEESESEYPFENGYELFTAGLVIGYTKDEEHDTAGTRDLIPLANLDGSMHGSCIKMVFSLVAAEDADDFESENEVWQKLLKYADWGVGWIHRHHDREDGIEFTDILDELDDLWEDRVQAALDTAQESRDSGAGDLTWEG